MNFRLGRSVFAALSFAVVGAVYGYPLYSKKKSVSGPGNVMAEMAEKQNTWMDGGIHLAKCDSTVAGSAGPVLQNIANPINSTVERAKKCTEYISWNDFYMFHAVLASKRSKDPVTKVGACIVDANNRLVATGYNGMPVGLHDDVMSWDGTAQNPSFGNHKQRFVVHAEANAIGFRTVPDVRGCMYVTLFPCNECAKDIISAGISKIFYLTKRDKETYDIAQRMLELVTPTPVTLVKFQPQGNPYLLLSLVEPSKKTSN